MSSKKKNYNKISTEAAKVEPTTEVIEEVTENVEAPKPEFKTGIVYKCVKLNLRVAPDLNAEIRGTIEAGDTVIILDEVGDFYKVGNPENPDYCMKKYISVKK